MIRYTYDGELKMKAMYLFCDERDLIDSMEVRNHLVRMDGSSEKPHIDGCTFRGCIIIADHTSNFINCVFIGCIFVVDKWRCSGEGLMPNNCLLLPGRVKK